MYQLRIWGYRHMGARQRSPLELYKGLNPMEARIYMTALRVGNGASIALKTSNKVSAGALGVAFLNAVTLGETLTQFILAWTGLETSLGAIARIAFFQRQTPVEDDGVAVRPISNPPQGGVPTARGPGSGSIRFENVWATYNLTAISAEGASDQPPYSNTGWSLRGVSLDIRLGERIAVYGQYPHWNHLCQRHRSHWLVRRGAAQELPRHLTGQAGEL